MTSAVARPVGRAESGVDVSIRVPGSKSVSCRALVLAALARGTSELGGLLRGEDTDALAAAIASLGVPVRLGEDETVMEGGGPLSGGGQTVHVGHGGAPARFLLALASAAEGDTTIDGSSRLRERPMGDMSSLLAALGIDVDPLGDAEHLPLRVRGGHWKQRVLEVGETASSQFLSALMLVAPSMPDGLELRLRAAPTSAPYLALTIAELRRWGVEVQTGYGDGYAARITVPHTPLQAQRRAIPPDASSALFWGVAATILPGSCVRLPGVSLDDGQPDAAAFSVLEEMGLQVSPQAGGVTLAGPQAVRSVGRIDCDRMPDAAPALAVACLFADAPTQLTGLSTLRHKESDRVATVAGELSRAGGDVAAVEDDLIVRPGILPDTPVTLETWDDHRIAMAGAVLGLRRGGVSISDPDCVAKSYPDFWRDLLAFAPEPPTGDTA
ncbi:MAG: 3-phosphoshikimate 1-carboxyvinyltransferase [Phycisphaerales bacterium]|nr:3-phosphoshikimate 1-carboxyvinyltransferase [Phycisphaerales bacterium]